MVHQKIMINLLMIINHKCFFVFDLNYQRAEYPPRGHDYKNVKYPCTMYCRVSGVLKDWSPGFK